MTDRHRPPWRLRHRIVLLLTLLIAAMAPALSFAADDPCEPNDTLVQPCALTRGEERQATLTAGDQDTYSIELSTDPVTIVVTPRGAATVQVTATTLDALQTPLYQVRSARPGTAVLLPITPDAPGWWILTVTAPAAATPTPVDALPYTIQVRVATPAVAAAPSGPAGQATATPISLGDAYENNYDLYHAAHLVWGVPYDLSLVCPDPRPDACPAGDHDFYLAPLKAGVPFTAVTYDLGPGTDTVLSWYVPDPTQTSSAPGSYPGWRGVRQSDDIVRGVNFGSRMLLTPPFDAQILIVVSPQDRQNAPPLPANAGTPGRYRMIIGSPAQPAVAAVLATIDPPPPTPAAAPAGAGGTDGGAAGAAPARPTPVLTTCAGGTATVVADVTGIYDAPARDAESLAELRRGTTVTLTGSCQGAWVQAQTPTGVVPGWIWSPDLERGGDAAAPTPAAGERGTGGGTTLPTGQDPGLPTLPGLPSLPSLPQIPGLPGSGSAAGGTDRAPVAAATLRVRAPAVLPMDPAPAPVARTIRVQVCALTREAGCSTPLRGITVDVLRAAALTRVNGGVSGADGMVTIPLQLTDTPQLQILLPQLGISLIVRDGMASPIVVRVHVQGKAAAQ